MGGKERKVLVVSSDVLPYPGFPTTGAGLRAWNLGLGLKARGHEVAYSMPRCALEKTGDVPNEVREYAWDEDSVEGLIRQVRPDVALFCHWPTMLGLKGRLDIPTALDLAGPHMLEREFLGLGGFAENAVRKAEAISKADFFSCSGERQRSYFLLWLMLSGVDAREHDIHLMRYSLPLATPQHLFEGETTFVYGGAMLPWHDPFLSLEALVEALDATGRGRLKMFVSAHPIYPIEVPPRFHRTLERFEEHPRVEIRSMIPHDEMVKEYLKAHVAVDCMGRNVEREMALTSRSIEYLWCGLPIIYNNYAELSRDLLEYGAGWALDPQDKTSIRKTIRSILENPEELVGYSRNAQRLIREKYASEKVVEPLDRFCRAPYRRVPSGGELLPITSVLGGGGGGPRRSDGKRLSRLLGVFREKLRKS